MWICIVNHNLKDLKISKPGDLKISKYGNLKISKSQNLEIILMTVYVGMYMNIDMGMSPLRY